MPKLSGALVLSLVFAGVLARLDGQDRSELREARIPEFPRKALASPHATKAGVFVSKDGRMTRWAVHLRREGMPEWLHEMADKEIGKGEDLDYEAELYPDGSEVFEIYRRVDGREKQLSVHVDRTVKYVGTEVPISDLPEKVRSTLKETRDFVAERCIHKQGPAFSEYQVKGMMGGSSCRVRIGPDGRRIAVQRKVPAELEVAVQE